MSPAACTLEYSVTVECFSLWWPCSQCCTNGLVTAVLGTEGLGWRLVVALVGGPCLSTAPQCLRGRRHPDSPTGLRLQLDTGDSCCLSLRLSISLPLSHLSSSSSSELPLPQRDSSEMKHWLPLCRRSIIHNDIAVHTPPPHTPILWKVRQTNRSYLADIRPFRLLLKITFGFLDYIQSLVCSQTFSQLATRQSVWLWASQSKTMALYQECLWLAGCNCSAPFLLAPVNCSMLKLRSCVLQLSLFPKTVITWT